MIGPKIVGAGRWAASYRRGGGEFWRWPRVTFARRGYLAGVHVGWGWSEVTVARRRTLGTANAPDTLRV